MCLVVTWCLIPAAIDVADPEKVGILSLFNDYTITNDNVMLLGIDHNDTVIFQQNRVLLQELMKFWADKMNHLMLTDRKVREMGPKDRLQSAAEKFCDKKLAGCELTVRQWAQCGKTAKKTIQAVDQLRLGFVIAALSELGISGEEAKIRASLYICSVSWEPHLMEKMPRKKWRELVALRIKFLTAIPKS